MSNCGLVIYIHIHVIYSQNLVRISDFIELFKVSDDFKIIENFNNNKKIEKLEIEDLVRFSDENGNACQLYLFH